MSILTREYIFGLLFSYKFDMLRVIHTSNNNNGVTLSFPLGYFSCQYLRDIFGWTSLQHLKIEALTKYKETGGNAVAIRFMHILL